MKDPLLLSLCFLMRPENMEDTIRMAGLSGKVPQSAGKPKSIKPMAAKQSQVMKPGAEI